MRATPVLLLAVGVLAVTACDPRTPGAASSASSPAPGPAVTPGSIPSPEAPAVSPTPSAAPRAATRDDVLTAEVPAYCDMPGARLAGGRAQLPNGFAASLQPVEPAYADLDADGVTEAFAFVRCTRPDATHSDDTLVMVGPGGRLRATLDLTPQRSTTGRGTGLRAQGDALLGTVMTEKPAGIEVRQRIRWADGKLHGVEVDPLEGQRLTTDGLGPFRIGMPESELYAAGLAKRAGDDCPLPVPTGPYADRVQVEVIDGRVATVGTTSSGVQTASGARVGMTRAQLKGLYGDQLVEVPPQASFTRPVYGVNTSSGRSMIFTFDEAGQALHSIEAHQGKAYRRVGGEC